jgi:excisionase family DNA binding protein
VLLYSPTNVAKLIDFGRTTVYELIKEGKIPSVQVAGRTRVRRDELEAWIESESRSKASTRTRRGTGRNR